MAERARLDIFGACYHRVWCGGAGAVDRRAPGAVTVARHYSSNTTTCKLKYPFR